MTLMELLQKGGPLMIPLGILSLLAAVLTIERILALRIHRIVPEELHKKVLSLLRDKNFDAAEAACAANDSGLARVSLTAMRHRRLSRAEIKELMQESGELEVSWMSRFVEGIGTIATVAPLVGLLGTVTGMIQVFQKVSAEIQPSIAQLAEGIWEALITTGAGLTVAIPSYLAYRWLDALMTRRVMSLEEASLQILDTLHEPVSSEDNS
jgi:biopolymer transport protein ExbB